MSEPVTSSSRDILCPLGGKPLCPSFGDGRFCPCPPASPRPPRHEFSREFYDTTPPGLSLNKRNIGQGGTPYSSPLTTIIDARSALVRLLYNKGIVRRITEPALENPIVNSSFHATYNTQISINPTPYLTKLDSTLTKWSERRKCH